jgi:hypothetical protein
METKLKASISRWTIAVLLSWLAPTHADSCFIDGALIPRCLGVSYDQGVSWPVFTGPDAESVLNESDRRNGGLGVPYVRSKIFIRVMEIDTADYPDVVCFTFKTKGKSNGSTCFDPMEITER